MASPSTRTALKMGDDLRLPLDVVTRRTTILGQTDTGKTSTAVVLVEEVAKRKAQYVVLDPTGAWWGLTSNAAGDGPGLDCVVMGGRHGDIPLDEGAGREVARLVANEGYSFVLDLDRLKSWAARQRFTADFCSELYEQAHSQIFVVIDEAHRLAPQGRLEENGHAARCLGAVSDMVLLGRRRGLSTLLVCQRPAKLNKDVLEMSEILIAHRVRGNNDRAQLKGWIEDNDLDVKTLIAEIAGLAKGVAHVSAPTLGINGTYVIRPKTTFDSSRSIGPGEVEIQPKVRSEVDMDALRERMTATIAKAEADDPKLLRKRIRELEREIAERPEVAPEPVEVQVPVPFIPPEILKGVADLATHIEKINGTITAMSGALTQRAEDLPALPAPRPRPAPRAAARPAAPRPAPRAPREHVDGEIAVSGSQQRILDALAMLANIGVQVAPKVQVALFAKQSPKSSGFTNNLGALRSGGLIDYPQPGMVTLTDAGAARADGGQAPSTVAELWAFVEQLVGASKWRILRALTDVYPESLSKAELADLAEASVTSSGYTNNLGALRSLKLLDYPEPGRVAAEPILFLDEA